MRTVLKSGTVDVSTVINHETFLSDHFIEDAIVAHPDSIGRTPSLKLGDPSWKGVVPELLSLSTILERIGC